MKQVDFKLEKLLNIFDLLKGKLKWGLSTQYMLLIATMYHIHNKLFSLDELIELSNYIKNNSKLFSPFRSTIRYHIAATLIIHYENPKYQFSYLKSIVDHLVQAGFKRNNFTIIAALSLLNTPKEELNVYSTKAFELYQEMKKKHFFLTSHSDYPLTVLLSQLDLETPDIIADIEYYYGHLSDTKLKKGNNLQFLSHILMLIQRNQNEQALNQIKSIFQSFKDLGVSLKGIHYPVLGVFTAFNFDLKEEMKQIKEIHDILNHKKGLRQFKDLNLLIASMIVMKNRFIEPTVLETNLVTTIEAIIQAQNAAIIAAITAASASSASTN